MPEEQRSQMSKCAFPPWLLNNRHRSFTLIKIKFLLPLLLLHFLYASTVTLSFFPLLYSNSIFPVCPCSASSSLSLPPCPHSSLIVSLSLCSGRFLTPSPCLICLALSVGVCRTTAEYCLGKMKGSIRLQSAASLLTQQWSTSTQRRVTLPSPQGHTSSGADSPSVSTDKEANEAAL